MVRRKGHQVVTVRPDESVERLLALLEEHRIGALVVSDDGESVSGIVSERDVVWRLASEGPGILQGPISQIMTTEVRTCNLDAHIEDLARTMTEHRIRHIPVIADGRLVGVVSIGDVVKHRLGELSTEAQALHDYVTSGR